MKDYSNDPEITENITRFIDDGSEIKLSLVICVWNTSHLLKRSIETYCKQDLPTKYWELIVINDSSEDDVIEAIEFAYYKINIRYVKLAHNFGMRGNTKSFNVGFSLARGFMLAESTPETMFPTDLIRRLYEPHGKQDNIFVAVKTWNLTRELQLAIDTVDWREDLGNIMQLEGFFNDWTLNNFKTTYFGTHQTCSIRKDQFYRLFPNGYPLYADYGSEDPRFSHVRRVNGIRDITIMQPLAFHQWHAPWTYFQAKGKSPNTNKHGHTMSNYMNDTSGEVPEGGTCVIWDGGSHEQLTAEEIEKWKELDEIVRATGCKVV